MLCIFYALFWISSTNAFPVAESVFPTGLKKLACSVCNNPTQLRAAVDISESAQRDIGTFDEWASSCGVQRCDGFQLTATSDENSPLDIGIMTTENLPAESPVLYVPSEMILSAEQAKLEIGKCEEAEKRILSSKASEYLSQFYLFLKILLEYYNGDQSPWFPWLNALPRYYSNGASMTPFCFECLPPLAANLAMGERIKFIQFYQALKYIDFLPEVSKELAKWAFAIVFTRGFESADGDWKVAPMADMFNHGTETQVQLQFDESGSACMYSTCDVPAGSQLCMSYGDPTNPSHLFARYGFLDESSPATFCKIMIPRPSPELVNMGYDHSKMLFYKETGEISPEVWDVMLYQILVQDPSAQQRLYQAHMNGDENTKQAMHQEYFPQTSVALQNHVEAFLMELDLLSGKGAGKDISEHPRLPLILEHNQFVKQTFLKVREQLGQYA